MFLFEDLFEICSRAVRQELCANTLLAAFKNWGVLLNTSFEDAVLLAASNSKCSH